MPHCPLSDGFGVGSSRPGATAPTKSIREISGRTI